MVSSFQTIAYLKFLYDFFPKASFFQITKADILPFIIIKKNIAEIFLGKIINDEKAFCNLLLLLRFRACFSLFNFHSIFISQPAKRFYIRILFMLHQKTDGITTAAATKTFINLFNGRNSEGRRFLVMKRAKTKIVRASFFKFHKTTDNINNVDFAEYLLYRFLRDQNIDFNINLL